jgi:hypothetical protein
MGLVFPTPLGTGSPSIANTPATVSNLFQLIGESSDLSAQGQSFQDIAAGDVAEAGAYGEAGDIARGNARLAIVGGQIEQAQEQVKLGQTIGSQKAAVAAGGFASSGSALSLLRSSTQQGLLQQQITGVNSELQAGGYEAQGAASDAEAAAATAAGKSATDLSAHAIAMAAATKTYATNVAGQMSLTVPGLANLSGTNIPSVPGANDLTTNNPNNQYLNQIQAMAKTYTVPSPTPMPSPQPAA